MFKSLYSKFEIKIPVIFRMLPSCLRAVVNLPPQRHRCPDRHVCLTIKEMIISIDEGKGPRTMIDETRRIKLVLD